MDIDSAANFLIGSILIGAGLLVLCTCLLVVNNLFSKWWKPVNFGYWAPYWSQSLHTTPARFMTDEEEARHNSNPKIEPKLEKASK